MSHFKPREDAVWLQGRRYVPTVYGEAQGNTRWVRTWQEFKDADGVRNFNEDQTEVVLTVPAGVKFAIGFGDKH